MDRRRFVAAAGGLFASPLVRAQKQGELRIVGVLTPHKPLGPTHPISIAVFARYKQLGWVEGESIRFVRPDNEGREDQLPSMAEDLVRKKVDVIYAVGPEAAVAAARATQTIPIVFWGASRPVEHGLVDSIARPGRNVTGMAFAAGMESTKVLETLTEIVPSAKRVAYVRTTSVGRTVKGEAMKGVRMEFLDAVKQLDLDMPRFDIEKVEDFDNLFASILRARAQAIFVPGTTLTFRERQRFVDFALQYRLPSAFNQFEFVTAGGLFSYGIDSLATVVDAVKLVDRILRGAKPADLPVELPSKFQLVLNLKTAATLGIKMPQKVLARADRVIE